jgi:hypothetical protein
MKRLAILAAFVVVMGTSAVMADGRGTSNCATGEPIVSTPPQDGCGSSSCAQPEPVETQIAGCGRRGRCARPEPDPDLADWVTANTA